MGTSNDHIYFSTSLNCPKTYLSSTRLEQMVGRGGVVDSPQQGYGELGTMELVEPEYAIVDDGGLAVAWQEFVCRDAKTAKTAKTLPID